MRKIVIIFTLISLALLATNAIPALRGAAGWEWVYQLPTNWTPVIVLAFLLAFYVLISVFLRRFLPDSRSFIAPLVLLWCVLGGAVLGFAAAGVRGDPFQ